MFENKVMLGCTAGKVDITPNKNLPIAGYREYRVSDKINDQLEANYLILFENAKAPIVILSFDLLYVGKILREFIWNGIKDILHKQDNLLCFATHTHFAPATDETLPYLGAVDRDYIEGIATKIIKNLRKDLTEKTKNNFEYQYKKGTFKEIVNRRLWQRQYHKPFKFPHTLKFRPNVKGPKNTDIHIIEVLDSRSQLYCILWSFSCHPVGFPDKSAVSSDYPGFIRKEVRQSVGNDIPIIFLQGATGEVRPLIVEKCQSAFSMLRRLLTGASFGKFTHAEWRFWCKGLYQEFQRATLQEVEKPTTINTRRITKPLSTLIRSNNLAKEISFHKIEFGNALQIVGISTEPMIKHAHDLQKLSHHKHGLLIGYMDAVHGYWPTNKQLSEGGYEADTHRDLFCINGQFVNNPDKIMLDTIKELNL